MPGRKYAAGSLYRYGFNGKENDNEVDGEGGQQDYGMRIYDPRIGRFLSVDPISKDYPELTPYQFSSNNPISGIDIDGLEFGIPLPWQWRLPRLTIPEVYIPPPPTIPLPPIVLPPPQGVNEAPTTIRPSIPEWEYIDLENPFVIRIPGNPDASVPDFEYVYRPSDVLEPWKVNKGRVEMAKAYRPGPIDLLDDAPYSGTYKEKKPTKDLKHQKSKDDTPDWARPYHPRTGEKGADWAKRLLDGKYGKGNWNKGKESTGPESEFSKIKKYGDHHFKEIMVIGDRNYFNKLWHQAKEYNSAVKEGRKKLYEQMERAMREKSKEPSKS